ncbi:hypothetical protein BN946_scf184992.g29 [Trametes cinnabarina]|uniref:ATP citrate synthase n=1 Tax=Pycnoporus cinnabarinus TaxID=5643 RepID=A0A060S428_PYCCI|nr:hypothetical protein BN946_scf184992.g29 [Trametes cinnabarina]
MSSKAIREYDAKLLLAYWLERAPPVDPSAQVKTKLVYPTPRVAQISWDPATNTITPENQLPGWVFTTKLVAKPDQLIKRRGKAGLLALNKTWEEAKEWIVQRAGKPQKVESVTGTLNNFIVEPFLPHPSDAEYYVCINSEREGDYILFTHEGGVDIGDVDAKALKLSLPVGEPFPSRQTIADTLLKHVPASKKETLVDFLIRLYSVYVDLHFAYLEINPLVVLDGVNGGEPTIHYLDMAAKLDQTAESICGPKWAIARDLSVYESGPQATTTKGKIIGADRGPPMVWPAPFGRDLTKEEAYIQKLDASTGASLKLTVLNPEGRIWTMVAGGGASVVYSDAIAAHGFAHELANYGEYSGAPSEGQTYEYAKTILDLMTRGKPRPDGKILIIGGGIANFTNVAATFKGIIRALKEYKAPLVAHQVKIYVRRGGPNYQEGLKAMRLLGESLGVPIKVYGPDTHITAIVPLALGVTSKPKNPIHSIAPTPVGPPSPKSSASCQNLAPEPSVGSIHADGERTQAQDQIVNFEDKTGKGSQPQRPWYRPFDAQTRSFVYGLQPRAIQGMLDFDYSCGRDTPSVAAMIYPFGGHHIQKFYWGTKETLLPVYTSVAEACKKHPDVDVVVNFASSRMQFGHAGSMANSDMETADAKNAAMRAAGFIVPDTFEDLPEVLKQTYERLVSNGTIKPQPEREPPVIPMDYKWAQELGLIRKPAAFISTISDERGQELLYAGMRISDVFKEDIGVGGVVSLLWFKRRLPPWATKFIEMVLMLTADHGPAVSGAMNTIVATRAGKDLISSLASGLLTIGSRFGGALDEAASMFSNARDTGLTPREFVDSCRKQNKLISGIGHKIKSVNNPDLRVELVKEYVHKHFPSHSLLDYALAVEKVTTSKKDTLILNVDGCIAVCFVDLLRDSGAFTPEEADEYIKIGTLNGLFVLGRSIGFIGHHLDQKRLRAPLYRHPADDIFINMADISQPRVLGKMQ